MPSHEQKDQALSFAGKATGQPLLASQILPSFPKAGFFEHYLTESYNGQELFSKSGLFYFQTFDLLLGDIKEQLIGRSNFFNRSLINNIWEEFNEYCASRDICAEEIAGPKALIKFIQNPAGHLKEHVELFVDTYSCKIAVIYLFKLRFINALASEQSIKVETKDIFNPNYFLNKIFKKGSSREVPSEALESNLYSSWYIPNSKLGEQLLALLGHFPKIALAELAKLNARKFKKITRSRLDYSNSISSRVYGKFLNLILVNYPIWFEVQEGSKTALLPSCDGFPRPLECRYQGDYIHSLAISHWLAQEENSKINWNEIICPTFEGNKIEEAYFFKIIYELEFLTSLIFIAKVKKLSAVDYISNIFKKKRQAQRLSSKQIALFAEDNSNKQYDRSLLCLVDLPQKNPHHFLCQKIKSELEQIKENGYLFVMTNQKFFVPSQSERVKNVLNHYKFAGSIDIENLAGKGELGDYLYIFKKSESGKSLNLGEDHFDGNILTKAQEQTYMNFRFEGELSIFDHFKYLFKEFDQFLSVENGSNAPFFRKSLDMGLAFNCFQDGIKGGQLISSSSNDKSLITHPRFFDNLLKSCIRLGDLFHFEAITPREEKLEDSFSSTFLPRKDFSYQNYSLILILDNRTQHKVNIELIPSASYPAKIEEYGHALTNFFGMTPKKNQININLIKEFLTSEIGDQIVQRSLIGLPNKIKSNLKNLLIPKFLLAPNQLPSFLKDSIGFLASEKSDLINNTEEQLLENFQETMNRCELLVDKHPCAIAASLTQFKNTVQTLLEKVQEQRDILFTNPLVIEKLRKSEKYALYPSNDDFSISFNIKNNQDIFQPLTELKRSTKNVGDNEISCLSFFSGKSKILDLHGENLSISFISFLLSQAIGHSIGDILQNIKAPKTEKLIQIVDDYSILNKSLQTMKDQTCEKLEALFQDQISK